MIPIRDHNQTATTPFITHLLIGANVLIFGYMFMLPGAALDQFVQTYALIPREIIKGMNLETLITSMFLHGGIGHVLGNMLFLHIFGDNLEDYLGHLKYLFYYLLCGLTGSLLQIFMSPLSGVPNLGASGAIAGLMGGYLLLFPRNRVDVLIPFGLWLEQVTIPAWTMLGYWILAQFLLGLGSFGLGEGGVAYFAHIGGFGAGLVLVRLMRQRGEVFDL